MTTVLGFVSADHPHPPTPSLQGWQESPKPGGRWVGGGGSKPPHQTFRYFLGLLANFWSTCSCSAEGILFPCGAVMGGGLALPTSRVGRWLTTSRQPVAPVQPSCQDAELSGGLFGFPRGLLQIETVDLWAKEWLLQRCHGNTKAKGRWSKEAIWKHTRTHGNMRTHSWKNTHTHKETHTHKHLDQKHFCFSLESSQNIVLGLMWFGNASFSSQNHCHTDPGTASRIENANVCFHSFFSCSFLTTPSLAFELFFSISFHFFYFSIFFPIILSRALLTPQSECMAAGHGVGHVRLGGGMAWVGLAGPLASGMASAGSAPFRQRCAGKGGQLAGTRASLTPPPWKLPGSRVPVWLVKYPPQKLPSQKSVLL